MFVSFLLHAFSITDVNSLPGPPISSETTITKLQSSGVLVGIGVTAPDFAKNARFDLTWVCLLLTPRLIDNSRLYA